MVIAACVIEGRVRVPPLTATPTPQPHHLLLLEITRRTTAQSGLIQPANADADVDAS
jgi:hypothetical protein